MIVVRSAVQMAAGVLLAVGLTLPLARAVADDAPATETPSEIEEDALVAVLAEPWTGDLDGIVERGYLRFGTAYNPIMLSYDGPKQQGLSVDLAAEFEKHLRKTLGKSARNLTVVLTPLPREGMLDALIGGTVDVLAANLTITPERAARMDFAEPIYKGVAEITVTGPAAPPIEGFDDLAKTQVHVRRSSSYFEHLTALNARRVAEGAAPIPVVEADENLEDNDLIELVDVGVIPAVIVDSHKAELWAKIFEHVTLRSDLAVNEGGEIAWAMRKHSPQLMATVNGFMDEARKGTALGNILFKRYLVETDRVRNALAPGEDTKFVETIDFIRTHAAAYDFDGLLIAAQGYQESGLDQSKRSHVGAIGIMQIMPATARDPNVGIADIHVAERNVEAGVKYLDFLRDRYFSDPAMSPLDRALFSFAAYNAGPGNIAKARKRAAQMGLDPKVWFNQVELAAARVISREPVIYVRNILKYYVTYRLFDERRAARASG
jgi:membrane-bound lytic murein transglycosylase MltF